MSADARARDGQEGAPTPPWRHPAALLALALGAMLVAQVSWLVLNRRPVDWDPAWYLETSVSLRRVLIEQGGVAFLREARGAFGVKAPGVSMAAALVMALVGESVQGAAAVSQAAWVIAAVYLYLLGRRLVSAEAAALAALLWSAMPLAFSLARSMFVEASLTLAVVAFLFHAAASDQLRRPWHVAALAVWGALGLMVKVTFPAYVLAPALVLSVTPWTEARRGHLRLALTWAGIATAACGMAAWLWYADNWRTTLEFARNAGFGASAAVYAVPVSTYLAAAALHAVMPWVLVCLVALVGHAVARRAEGVTWRAVLVAAVWLVPPFVMLVSSSNRYVRYLAPVLPALALAVAALAEPWMRPSARAAWLAVGVLTGPLLAYFLVATIPTPLAGTIRASVESSWLGGNANWYEGPPDRRPWPNAAIIAAAARATGGDPAAVLRLNVDLPELNHNNLRLEAVRQRAPVLPAQIDQSSPDGALATALDGDLLLLQTGGEVASDFLNVQRAVVARELAAGRHPYHEVASFEVPGGRRVTLLERRCVIEAEGTEGPPLATLERGLELLSLEVARPTAGLVSVRTRYRARSDGQPLLSVRVEVAGTNGQVLGRGEHPLCRRSRPPWPAGAVIEDTILLPADAMAPGLVLRLGLRDLRTGASLRVERVGAGVQAVDGVSVAVGQLAERITLPATR
jgi:4-amino-4-deoxy-L-arabinose transferase-like glycosyltransferase